MCLFTFIVNMHAVLSSQLSLACDCFITKDGEKDKEVAVGSAEKEKTGKTEKESAEDMELEEKKPDGDSLSCKEESDDETLVSATLFNPGLDP